LFFSFADVVVVASHLTGHCPTDHYHTQQLKIQKFFFVRPGQGDLDGNSTLATFDASAGCRIFDTKLSFTFSAFDFDSHADLSGRLDRMWTLGSRHNDDGNWADAYCSHE
jgi:hypothetical protein